MSDFLNNLVARTLRLREPVRPRLASLFEPPAPSAVAPDALSAAHGRQTVEQDVEASTTVAPPAPPTFAPRPDARAQAGGELAGERREVGAVEVSTHREHEPPGQPSAQPSEAAEGPEAQREPAGAPAQVTVVGRDSRAVGEAGARGPEGAASRGEEAVLSLLERVAALEASRSEDGRRRETVVAPAGTDHATALAPPAPHAFAPRAQPPATARHDAGVEGSPQVTVRIGRVDVRAVTQAQSPQPRATRRAHTPTLEEYLKQREGGRR